MANYDWSYWQCDTCGTGDPRATGTHYAVANADQHNRIKHKGQRRAYTKPHNRSSKR